MEAAPDRAPAQARRTGIALNRFQEERPDSGRLAVEFEITDPRPGLLEPDPQLKSRQRRGESGGRQPRTPDGRSSCGG